MHLLIDAGNTRIKFGCHDGRGWCAHGLLAHDEASGLVQALPAGFHPRRVVVANVAGTAVGAALAQALAPWAAVCEWLVPGPARCGLGNRYEDPARLGADRWAAAIAAWQRLGRACLVVSAGTATTVDLIAADGWFEGGLILPGLAMMRAALAAGTADLPAAQGHFVERPRNTHDAIVSGCLQAQLGAIERMTRLLPAGAPILLTGGAAGALSAQLPQAQEVPELVLEGLLHLALAPVEGDALGLHP